MKMTASLWLMNSLTGEFLIQLSGPNKKRNPNKWETSASGQLDPGETSLQTVKREAFEELGLIIPESDFTCLGDFPGLTTTNKAKHFWVYFASGEYDIKFMKINASEIAMVKYAQLHEIKKMIGSPNCSIQPEKIKLLENYLKLPQTMLKYYIPAIYNSLSYN